MFHCYTELPRSIMSVSLWKTSFHNHIKRFVLFFSCQNQCVVINIIVSETAQNIVVS